jgi:DnaJ-class molecular chaperone
MADTSPNTCPTCNGTGLKDGDICSECCGRSTLPVRGMHYRQFKEVRGHFSDLMDKCNDILDKCNDILEEVQSE